jgi:hypothetical protein
VLSTARGARDSLATALAAALVAASLGWPLLGARAVGAAAAGAWAAAGTMHVSREDSALGVMRDHRILAAGGVGGGGALTSAEIYDPSTAVWSLTRAMGTPRSSASASLLDDGRVLVAGGAADGRYLSSAELYDPVHGSWTPTGSMAFARRGHTATRLADGRVLVVGGFDGDGFAEPVAYLLLDAGRLGPTAGRGAGASLVERPEGGARRASARPIHPSESRYTASWSRRGAGG